MCVLRCVPVLKVLRIDEEAVSKTSFRYLLKFPEIDLYKSAFFHVLITLLS